MVTIRGYMEDNYPGLTFDGALPEEWVRSYIKLTGKSPVGSFTWGYPPGVYFGVPIPLCDEAERELMQIGITTVFIGRK